MICSIMRYHMRISEEGLPCAQCMCGFTDGYLAGSGVYEVDFCTGFAPRVRTNDRGRTAPGPSNADTGQDWPGGGRWALYLNTVMLTASLPEG
ncbi:hypothetical protein ACFSQ7_43730 [Paenibacillus rhizoplanae]